MPPKPVYYLVDASIQWYVQIPSNNCDRYLPKGVLWGYWGAKLEFPWELLFTFENSNLLHGPPFVGNLIKYAVKNPFLTAGYIF